MLSPLLADWPPHGLGLKGIEPLMKGQGILHETKVGITMMVP